MKKYVKYIILAVGIVTIASIYILANNTDLLFRIASELDDPSKFRYIVIERLYKIYEKKDFAESKIAYITKGKNQNLVNTIVRVIGPIGETDATHDLIQLYIKYQDDNNFKSTLYYTIKSIGCAGDKAAIPFLETLLFDHNDLKVKVEIAVIEDALYLLTGREHYSPKGSAGNNEHRLLSKEQIQARSAILNQKDRRRTFEEMMMFELLFRPPGKK